MYLVCSLVESGPWICTLGCDTDMRVYIHWQWFDTNKLCRTNNKGIEFDSTISTVSDFVFNKLLAVTDNYDIV